MMNYLDFIGFQDDAENVPDEHLLERIRNWRNAQLASCDWTQVADSTADKTAWAAYRQKLRDLPASNVDPKKIKFPTRPA
jgi:hypothetical protein